MKKASRVSTVIAKANAIKAKLESNPSYVPKLQTPYGYLSQENIDWLIEVAKVLKINDFQPERYGDFTILNVERKDGTKSLREFNTRLDAAHKQLSYIHSINDAIDAMREGKIIIHQKQEKKSKFF